MFNNSSACGPNEAPANMVASVNASQSNVSNINHNLNDIGKYMQQTALSTREYYDPYNFHNIGRPAANVPPIMHPFETYQNIGHGSSFSSQNNQFSNENAIQNSFPPVQKNVPTGSYSNVLSFSENYQTKTLSDLLSSTFREPAMPRGYPLNIPQVPSNILRKSLSVVQEDKTLIGTEITNSMPLEKGNPNKTKDIEPSDQSKPQNESFPTNISVETSEGCKKHNNITNIKDHNKKTKKVPDINTTESSKTLSITPKAQENFPQTGPPSPKKQKTAYQIIKNNTEEDNTLRPIILKKTLSESKRKSLEKTVKIIESILISNSSNNTKTDTQERAQKTVAEENGDPLALSPYPTAKSSQESDSDSESDDEVLVKKASSNTNATSNSQKQIITNSKFKTCTNKSTKVLTTNQEVDVKVEDIKEEPMEWGGFEFENPFVRDCNGTNRDHVGDVKVISMENSVNEALATVKAGVSSIAYLECPDCQLLFLNAKRFLVHIKWHSFGLLNERRAELARERENHAKMKRDARRDERIQRLSASLPETEAEALRCKECDIVLPTKSSFKNHRAKVHPKQVNKCKVCHIPINDMQALREHLQTHENKEAGGHQCPHCPKQFKFRHSLTKHVDVHLEKTHSCPTCGKLFGSEAQVKRHLITHERQARGPDQCCTYCGKAFYEAYHLRVHERTHRNDRPFKCDTCQSGFVSNSSLKRHIKVSHSVNLAKPFACPVCKKCFSSAAICSRHELRAHADQTLLPHHCELCHARFVKLKDLKTHMYRLHPNTGTPKKRKSKKDGGNTENDE